MALSTLTNVDKCNVIRKVIHTYVTIACIHAGGRMGAALGLVMSTLLAAIISDALPPSTELAGFGGALAVATVLCWPIIGPLREMSQLSGTCNADYGFFIIIAIVIYTIETVKIWNMLPVPPIVHVMQCTAHNSVSMQLVYIYMDDIRLGNFLVREHVPFAGMHDAGRWLVFSW